MILKVKVQHPRGEVITCTIGNADDWTFSKGYLHVKHSIDCLYGRVDSRTIEGNILSVEVIQSGAEKEIDLSPLKPCKKYLGNSYEQQTLKLVEEVKEVTHAVTHETEERALEETIDVIQAGITFLSIFEKHGLDVNAAIQKVKEKNDAKDRQYYGK